MAVATKPAGGAAVHDETEMLISGSEAVAEALTLADVDVVTAYPIRPYDTVMQAIAKKIANGKLDRRVHRGGGRAQPVRDREARVDRGRARLLRVVRRRLDVRHGGDHGHAGAARPDGGAGGEPRARRPRRVRRRAQRRAVGARPGLAPRVDRHRPGGARHDADRVPGGRGPAGVPARCAISADGAFLTHSQTHHPGPDAGARQGRSSRRTTGAISCSTPTTRSRSRPQVERGLGDRDPPPERRGHASAPTA